MTRRCYNTFFLRLVENRIRPYYLIHFIPTHYTQHFATSLEKGRDILKRTWGYISGLGNPIYIVYLPNGKGKVMCMPDYLISHSKEGYLFETFEGGTGFYADSTTVTDSHSKGCPVPQ